MISSNNYLFYHHSVSGSTCYFTLMPKTWVHVFFSAKTTLTKGEWEINILVATLYLLSDPYYLNESMLMWRLFTDTRPMGIPDLPSLSPSLLSEVRSIHLTSPLSPSPPSTPHTLHLVSCPVQMSGSGLSCTFCSFSVLKTLDQLCLTK